MLVSNPPLFPCVAERSPVKRVDQIVDQLMALGEGARLTILAPVIRERKGEHDKILGRIRKEGFTRVRIDGEIRELDGEDIKLEKTHKHTIEIVIDRIIVKQGVESRLAESAEMAILHGEGLVTVMVENGDTVVFNTKLACPEHGISMEELEPRMFSFNSPFGACPDCTGLGIIERIDPDLIITHQDLSIPKGALANVFASMDISSFYRQMVDALAEDHKVDINTPYNQLPAKFKEELLYGDGQSQAAVLLCQPEQRI